MHSIRLCRYRGIAMAIFIQKVSKILLCVPHLLNERMTYLAAVLITNDGSPLKEKTTIGIHFWFRYQNSHCINSFPDSQLPSWAVGLMRCGRGPVGWVWGIIWLQNVEIKFATVQYMDTLDWRMVHDSSLTMMGIQALFYEWDTQGIEVPSRRSTDSVSLASRTRACSGFGHS